MEKKKASEDNPDQVSEVLITIDDHLHEQVQQQGKKRYNTILNPVHGPASHLSPAAHKPVSKQQLLPLQICVVPGNMRKLQNQAFDPKLVSIGPFHRGNEQHKPMEGHKWRFLSRLLDSMNDSQHGHAQYRNDASSVFVAEAAKLMDSSSSSSSLSSSLSSTRSSSSSSITQQQYGLIVANVIKLRPLIIAMKELESTARSSYSDDTLDSLGSAEFILLMLLDGCFVVELLRLYSAKCDKENVDDPIFSWHWTVPILQHDLLTVENQLPFTVLEKIYEITSSGKEHYSLTDLTIKFFDALRPRDNIRSILSKCAADNSSKPYHHLLGLFRYSFLSPFILDKKPSSSVVQQDGDETIIHDIAALLPPQETGALVACATELIAAGITLKKKGNCGILDIEFKEGKLYIPPLLIDNSSVFVLLNFFAYEQCNQCLEPYFTQYMFFFGSLLNSPRDVEHLRSKGIIDHVRDYDEDIANVFSMLHKEVVRNIHPYGYLSELLKNMYWYSRQNKCTPKKHFIADYEEWKHIHFRSPWAFLSFLGAILHLLFTVIQTFFVVLPFIRRSPEYR